MDCPNYVNYEQTGCVDTVPDGYFVLDQYRKLIDKCHELCKTCKASSYKISNTLYMNCETCLYNNTKFKTDIVGNCPESEGKNDDKEEDEDKKEENKKGLGFWFWSGIIGCIVLVIGIIIIVILIIHTKRKEDNDIPISDYRNIHGRHIAMEEDESLGI